MPNLRQYPEAPNARWYYSLRPDLSSEALVAVRAEAEQLAAGAQYGWGHTIDFGPFQMPGLLGNEYLRIAGLFDAWNWWQPSLEGLTVADIGCFTGGLSLLMASRGAKKVFAVDELAPHLAQCRFLTRVFGVSGVECLEASLYNLTGRIALESLDVVLLSGVLYHLSDLLVGLVIIQKLLKPGGILLIESNAVECFEHSYANFGRFVAGMWWQPTALCIDDMCQFTGFERPEIRFYVPGRCLARAVRQHQPFVPYRRGMNWRFESLRDEVTRSMDPRIMAPGPCNHE